MLTLDRIIGILGILATISIGIYAFLKTLPTKRVSCIFEPIGIMKPPIPWTIGGRQIHELSVVRARVQNVGNQPIKKDSDIARKLQFVFPQGTSILTANVIRQPRIRDPETTVTVSNSNVVCDFPLLNYRGDYFEVQIALEGTGHKHPEVAGELLGQRVGIVTRVELPEQEFVRHTLVSLIPIAIAAAFATLLFGSLGITFRVWPFQSSTPVSIVVPTEAIIMDDKYSLVVRTNVTAGQFPRQYRYGYVVRNSHQKSSVIIDWTRPDGGVILRAAIPPQEESRIEISSSSTPEYVNSVLRYGEKTQNVRILCPGPPPAGRGR